MENNKEIKRSRRLRKKLYVGEFTVFGFEASMSFDDIDETVLDSFLDELLAFVSSRNLSISCGGGVDEFDAFICSGERYGSATEDDREALSNWLNEKAFIQNIEVDYLVDANNFF